MGVYSGNRTYLGESTYNEDQNTHIMEMVLECERNDLRMFEAVINCDFIEAYNEAGIISLSEEAEKDAKEETKKGIGQKIKDLFKRAIEAVKRFVSTFISKLKNLFANDAKLYKEYKENFLKNGVGYKVYDWRTIKTDVSKSVYEVIEVIEPIYQNVVNGIDKAADNDAISKYVENIKKQIKERDIAKEAEEHFFDEKEEKHALTSSEVKTIANVVSSSTRAIDVVKNYGKMIINRLETQRKYLKAEKTLADDNDELTISRLNAKYKVAGIMIKYSNKVLNAVCNTYARYLAQCRKAFVMAGKNASAKKDQEKDQQVNASYDFMLGEASDDYVEHMLLVD